jgi:hypothetical protein
VQNDVVCAGWINFSHKNFYSQHEQGKPFSPGGKPVNGRQLPSTK